MKKSKRSFDWHSKFGKDNFIFLCSDDFTIFDNSKSFSRNCIQWRLHIFTDYISVVTGNKVNALFSSIIAEFILVQGEKKGKKSHLLQLFALVLFNTNVLPVNYSIKSYLLHITALSNCFNIWRNHFQSFILWYCMWWQTHVCIIYCI